MAKRDLVLGYASRLGVADLAPFVRSLRDAGYRGDCVVYGATFPRGTEAFLRSHDVEVIPAPSMWALLESVLPGTPARPAPLVTLGALAVARVLLEGLSRVLGLLDAPPGARRSSALLRLTGPLGSHMIRHVLYRELLAARPYERVLLADLRDVVFQRDPFASGEVDRPEALVAAEESLRLGWRGFTPRWIRARYGRRALRGLLGTNVVCNGVVLGGAIGIRRFADLMCRDVLRTVRAGTRFGDQACINWLMRGELASDPGVALRVLPPFNDLMVHLDALSRRPPPRDVEGRVLSQSGRPVAIVHQYDRHPGLLEAVRARYAPERISASPASRVTLPS